MVRRLILLTACALIIITLVDLQIENVQAQSSSVIRGNTYQLSIRLLQNGSYGDPVPNEEVEVYDESEGLLIGKAITDSNGIASISWTPCPNHTLGTTTLNVTFRGNPDRALSPCTQWIQLDVLKSSSIYTAANATRLSPGDTLSLSVQLKDDNSNGLAYSIIDLQCNDYHLFQGLTDDNGTALFQIPVNTSWFNLGINHILLTYGGNSSGFVAPSTETIELEVRKISTSIDLFHSLDTRINLNDSINLLVGVNSQEGYLPNHAIQFEIDGALIFTAITNGTGIAHLNLTFPPDTLLGPRLFSFTYQGSQRFSPSNYTKTIDVISFGYLHMQNEPIYFLGTEANINFTLKDSFGRPVPNTPITITNLNTSFSLIAQPPSTTIVYGIAMPITIPKGSQMMQFNYSSNKYLTNSITIFTIEVWSLPLIQLESSNIRHHASPNQEIEIVVSLTEINESCIGEPIQAYLNATIILESITDEYGRAVFNIQVPSEYGFYSLIFKSKMDQHTFRWHTQFVYGFAVDEQIPLDIIIETYTIHHSFKEIRVLMYAFALNGSYISNLEFYYSWCAINSSVISEANGAITILLAIPSWPGLYNFSYETKETKFLQAHSGFLTINITSYDSLAAEGIGPFGVVLGVLTSCTIAAVPFLRRKYLIG